MGIFKDIVGGIFGSAGGEMDWDGLMRMMELETSLNRTDRQGAFSGYEWEEDPETGRWTQNYTMTPGMQQGADRLMARSQGEGFDPYRSPEQFSTMLDSAMASQMQRQGTLDPNYQVQQPGGMNQFSPSADREGGFAQAYMPPPPPQGPPQGNMGPIQPPEPIQDARLGDYYSGGGRRP